MNAAPPSLLDPPAERLLPWFVPALLGHAGMVGALVLMEALGSLLPKAPLIEPEDAIEVSIVSMPKSKDLPTLAQRRPVPKAPEPAMKAPEAPPPPKVSDLALKTDKPDPKPTAVEAAKSEKLDQLMKDLQMNALLDELDAPEGKVDRDASSPDGVDGAPASNTVGNLSANPEYARYVASVSKLFLEQFRPLPALKGQKLATTVRVNVDAGGRVTGRQLDTSSGNASWDRAALAAAEAVTTIPLPPASLRDDKPDEYRIIFEDVP